MTLTNPLRTPKEPSEEPLRAKIKDVRYSAMSNVTKQKTLFTLRLENTLIGSSIIVKYCKNILDDIEKNMIGSFLVHSCK